MTDENFDQINAGMTTDETGKVLGEPQEIVSDNEKALCRKNENEDLADAIEVYHDFGG